MRQELALRPLLFMAAAMAVGTAFWFFPWLTICLALGAFCWKKWPYWVGALACFGIGAMLGPRPLNPVIGYTSFSDQIRIQEVPKPTMYGERFLASANGYRVLVYVPTRGGLSFGDQVRVEGQLRPLKPGPEQSWRFRGVQGVLSVRATPTVVKPGKQIGQWANEIRAGFAKQVEAELSAESAATVNSLCFNNDSNLSKEKRDQLVTSGTIHIISTSGMHVVLLATMLSWVLRRIPIPRSVQLGILFGILAVYAVTAGFRPPMVRSVLMAIGLSTAYIFRREADGLSLIALSAMGSMMMDPGAIFDIGFQLSFVTMLALVCFVPQLENEPGSSWVSQRLESWNSNIQSSFIASLAAAPLLLFHFGKASWVGVFANLFMAPAVPVVVMASLVGAAIAPFHPPSATFVFDWIVEPLTRYIDGVAWVFGRADWMLIQVPKPHPGIVCLSLIALFALWRPKPRT